MRTSKRSFTYVSALLVVVAMVIGIVALTGCLKSPAAGPEMGPGGGCPGARYAGGSWRDRLGAGR